MTEISNTFVNVDDSQIISLVETAQTYIVFMAPGLTIQVAAAIADRWQTLGNERVKVILDVDPEVARLGYGTLEGLEFIQEKASLLGAVVFHQAGLRIGVLIVDQTTIIFSPRPLLIEAGSDAGLQPNAICLDFQSSALMREIGWGSGGSETQAIGLQSVTPRQIEQVKADLQENPPQKFDITRTVQVFNSRFEFVELEVRGCSISRKMASIPPDLMAFIKDRDAQNSLHTSYQIVRQNSELSGKKIDRLRKQLVDTWMILIPSFGYVVLRKNKEGLMEGIEQLKREVEQFQEDIQEKLQKEIDHNCNLLIQSLLPSIQQNPPARWLKQIGFSPSKESLKVMLANDLRRSFGSAEDLIKKMEVDVIFKGITYEMLNDSKFIQAIHKAMPTIHLTHDEFEAARSVQATLF